MKQWRVTGKGTGHFYGVYKGSTEKDAVRAVIKEGGSDDEPNMENWSVVGEV